MGGGAWGKVVNYRFSIDSGKGNKASLETAGCHGKMVKRDFFSFCLLIWKPKTEERDSEGTSSKTVALRLHAQQQEMTSEKWFTEALGLAPGLGAGSKQECKAPRNL